MWKTLRQVKEEHVRAVLKEFPNRMMAAEVLAVSLRTLRNMIVDFKIQGKNKPTKKAIQEEKEDTGYSSVSAFERDRWYNMDRW